MILLFISMWVLWGITLFGAIYLLGENCLLKRDLKKIIDEYDKGQTKIIDAKFDELKYKIGNS